jgi:mitochondrial chaperone BCS1
MQVLIDDFIKGFRAALHSNPLLSGGVYLAVIGVALSFVRRLPMQILRLLQRRLILTVEIDSTDPGFGWLQVWLAKQTSTSRARHLILKTREQKHRTQELNPDHESLIVEHNRFELLLTPAPGAYLTRYRNRFMLIGLSRERRQNNDAFIGFHETIVIRMLGSDRSVIETLLVEARRLAVPDNQRRISIRVPRVGFWNAIDTQIPRPLESLVLSGDVANQIIADIRRFIGERQWYIEMGIPWRRSYLLYGEPGNGKTSLVKAVAGAVGLDIAALSLSGSEFNDEMLLGLVTTVPENSLLLLEDIDAVFVGRRRVDSSSSVTFTGLLNALDGVASRDGLIVFMTTNHKDQLDPALIRPGRADVHVYLGNATRLQMQRMFERFYGSLDQETKDRLQHELHDGLLSMAQVQEQLMRHRKNPHEAFEQLSALSLVLEGVGMTVTQPPSTLNGGDV